MNKKWEQFEIDAAEYLKNKFKNDNQIAFTRLGDHNSNLPDIKVSKDGKTLFYIEAKMSKAQAGQFVLSTESKSFIFSNNNKSTLTSTTKKILEYMNKNYKAFANSSTRGQNINLSEKILSSWVVEHYLSKNSIYIITYDKDYIVLPTDKLDKYFKVTAVYREKKSGSAAPAKKDYKFIKEKILDYDIAARFEVIKKKAFVYSSHAEAFNNLLIKGGNNDFLFVKKDDNDYEIRKLSNTRHSNVIFSLEIRHHHPLSILPSVIKEISNKK